MKRHDIPTPAVFAADLDGLVERGEENLGLHDKLGADFSDVIADVEQPILVRDGRHFLDVQNSVKASVRHSTPRKNATTEHGLSAVLRVNVNLPAAVNSLFPKGAA